MQTIKSFLYLDEYKMYSISSQIFEGLTEYIIDYFKAEKKDSEEQKGPIGSGRILADIISQQSGTQEKKFLHDYSYNLFESELIKNNRVLLINDESINANFKEIKCHKFIKVSGKTIFNDVTAIKNTLEKFNKIGEALTYVTTYKTREQQSKGINDVLDKEKDRNKRAKIKAQAKQQFNIKKLAKESGLSFDNKFLEHLSYLLNYGYKDHFEVQIPIETNNDFKKVIFSAVLKRDLLKENENILIKKYSRYSEKNITIFGIITQCEKESSFSFSKSEEEGEEIRNVENIKDALQNLVLKFANMEDTFLGRLSNEVIIDPISVYLAL